MATWGVLSVVLGLISMLFPGVIGSLGGASTNTFLLGSWGWLTAILGFGVLSASRDPIRHILWLRIAILNFLIGGAYDILHVIADTVTLSAIALDLGAYSVFGILFLMFYPRAPRMLPLEVRTQHGTLHTNADEGGLFVREMETGEYVPYSPPGPNPGIEVPNVPTPSPFASPAKREELSGRPRPPMSQPKTGELERDAAMKPSVTSSATSSVGAEGGPGTPSQSSSQDGPNLADPDFTLEQRPRVFERPDPSLFPTRPDQPDVGERPERKPRE